MWTSFSCEEVNNEGKGECKAIYKGGRFIIERKKCGKVLVWKKVILFQCVTNWLCVYGVDEEVDDLFYSYNDNKFSALITKPQLCWQTNGKNWQTWEKRLGVLQSPNSHITTFRFKNLREKYNLQ